MERLVTVEFGPSRSKRFGRALAEARSGAGECSEVEPGRYRARFVLSEDSAAYADLARLLERVRHWRATEVYEDDEPVSAFHAKEMAWCASFQLKSFRACRVRFCFGVLPRCSVCPLSTRSARSRRCSERTRSRRRYGRSLSIRPFARSCGGSSAGTCPTSRQGNGKRPAGDEPDG